jgi:hypothetical protein
VSALNVVRRYGREVRAGLIGLAIALGLLDGCPIPNASERPAMERRVGPRTVAAVDALDGVRQVLLRPFRPLAELAGLRQRWKLFAGASRLRFRMSVEARTSLTTDAWQLIYRPLDDEHDRFAGPIEYRRVRGAWNPSTSRGPRSGYAAFVTWIAGAIFDRDPAVVEVRVRMEKIEIGLHGGIRATGEHVYVQSRRRWR